MPPCHATIANAIRPLGAPQAQTREQSLTLQFGSETIITPGTFLPRAIPTSQPALSIDKALMPTSSAPTYFAIMFDLNAPYPSLQFLSPILHWLQTDLRPVPIEVRGGRVLLTADTQAMVSYLLPGPPFMSGPHRYLCLLFEQPAGVTRETMREAMGLSEDVGVWERLRWDQGAFERQVGLGAVVAANYFTCR
jgi:phosphatidylethanolamine-binding protein (PEBP) family uncharacterized protein